MPTTPSGCGMIQLEPGSEWNEVPTRRFLIQRPRWLRAWAIAASTKNVSAMAVSWRERLPKSAEIASAMASSLSVTRRFIRSSRSSRTAATGKLCAAKACRWAVNRAWRSRGREASMMWSPGGLVRANGILHLGGEDEAGPKFFRQLRRALAEGVDAGAVDELQGAAGPGRKADAEDRADIGVVHRGEHVLRQATRRFHGLTVQQAVLQFGHVPDYAGLLEQL